MEKFPVNFLEIEGGSLITPSFGVNPKTYYLTKQVYIV